MLIKKSCSRFEKKGEKKIKSSSLSMLPIVFILALSQFLVTPMAYSFPFFGNDKGLPVRSEQIAKKSIDGLNLDLQIWFPKTKKSQPVIIFFTGMTGLITAKVYGGFIKQMTAKGINVISLHSTKNYPGQFKATAKESFEAVSVLKQKLNPYLYKKHRGIAQDLLNWDQTVLMGHSSGAQPVIAFYRLNMEETKGIVLLDPVDGDPFGKTEKTIKPHEHNNFKAPLLVSGTEFCKEPGYDRKWFPPCCPEGLSSMHFYEAFTGPKWYVNALDYAHVDLLDDGFAWIANKTRFCKPSEGADKSLVKKFNAEMIADFINNTMLSENKSFEYLKKDQQAINVEIIEGR
ncbi:MAG: hypothetical protein HRU09_09980 [Oligoflexales bacterium]|nr:hypothetical protein [Oligoflexales bacterium]